MDTETTRLFRLISRALSYPDECFIPDLQNLIGQVNLDSMDNQQLGLAAFIRELTNLSQIPIGQVQGEYTRLFVCAYPRVICSPYESANREGVLMGKSTQDVFEIYQEWGIEAETGNVDHVGSELEFLAFLLTIGSNEALADAYQFMDDHMLRWMPAFASDLQKGSRLGFYREIGRLLKIVFDHQVIIQSFT